MQRPHFEVNKKLVEVHPGHASYVLDGGLVIGVDYGETGRRRLRTRLPDSLVSMQGTNLAEPVLLLLHPLLLFSRPRLDVHHGWEQFESGLRREQTATTMQRVQIE